MVVEHIILALVLMLGLSLLAQPVSRLLHMPLASILVLLGYITSELVISVGFDNGIRSDNFQSLIFYVFIPVLVFESAYNIDKLIAFGVVMFSLFVQAPTMQILVEKLSLKE